MKFKVNEATGCWEWQGHVREDGYAQTTMHKRRGYVHRLNYEHHRGPIPDGLVLDHLCKVRHCVNPLHLEPVTQAVNCQRGDTGKLLTSMMQSRAAAMTHCKRGHEFTEQNTQFAQRSNGTVRVCRACRRQREAEYAARRK